MDTDVEGPRGDGGWVGEVNASEQALSELHGGEEVGGFGWREVCEAGVGSAAADEDVTWLDWLVVDEAE